MCFFPSVISFVLVEILFAGGKIGNQEQFWGIGIGSAWLQKSINFLPDFPCFWVRGIFCPILDIVFQGAFLVLNRFILCVSVVGGGLVVKICVAVVGICVDRLCPRRWGLL